MPAEPCTTWPLVGKVGATGTAHAKPTHAIDKTKAPLKKQAIDRLHRSTTGDSPEDFPWLQACSPTATRQPKCFEKTVLKQCAFIGINHQHGLFQEQAQRFEDFNSIKLFAHYIVKFYLKKLHKANKKDQINQCIKIAN